VVLEVFSKDCMAGLEYGCFLPVDIGRRDACHVNFVGSKAARDVVEFSIVVGWVEAPGVLQNETHAGFGFRLLECCSP
jgi:hypothetical protein